MKKISILSLLLAAFVGSASANWQYPGYYAGEGSYHDDGSRFVVSLRGGLSWQHGKTQNDFGALVPDPYYVENDTGYLVTDAYCQAFFSGPCPDTDYTFVGQVDIAELPTRKNISSTSWASSVGVGFTVPNTPQLRIEGNWDHISETSYNVAPMFEGELTSTTGDLLYLSSTGINSKITTDIISAMIYYDFFSGYQKPIGTIIPYIGVGAGYAISTTVLNLSDLYGDLSNQADMQEFGTDTGGYTLDFYQSKTNNSNIAGAVALGFSYAFTDGVFLDFGAKAAYIPKIKWELNNQANADAVSFKSKDIFSAKDMFFVNVLLGLRFEF